MKFTKVLALLLLCPILLAGCGSRVSGGDVVMTVGDMDVTESEFNFYMTTYKENIDLGEVKNVALKYCKKSHLIIAVGKAMGIEFDEETTKNIKESKKRVITNYDNNGGYKTFLKENNLTDEFFDRLVSVEYYANELRSYMEKTEYTEAEKRDYFKDNYRRAKHIFLSTKDSQTGDNLTEEKQEEVKAKAEDLLQRLQNGEDMDLLIAEYSDDPESESNPDGYLFTDNEMMSEFQNGVDSINVGEFTVVKSALGYHVIEKLGLVEGSELFEEHYFKVSANLSQIMLERALEEQLDKWADEKGITVTVNQDVIDKIEE